MKRYQVTLATNATVPQAADYFRIEQGCLCFRLNAVDERGRRPTTSDPELVRVFAPGVWNDVILLPDDPS